VHYPDSEIVVRWYGRRGATNKFTLSSGGGPPRYCESEIYELLSAIDGARSSVAADAASQSFALPEESYRNAPARPLLVMTTYATTLTLLEEPLDPRVFVSSVYLFADRTLIQSFNHSPEPFGVEPQISSYLYGRVPIAEWNDLVAQMTAARVDAQGSCQIPTVGAPAIFANDTSERVVRWYGRRERRNTFSINRGDDAVPGCDVPVLQFATAVSRATEKVLAASTSEYFAVP
jgi:hypothetical protein